MPAACLHQHTLASEPATDVLMRLWSYGGTPLFERQRGRADSRRGPLRSGRGRKRERVEDCRSAARRAANRAIVERRPRGPHRQPRTSCPVRPPALGLGPRDLHGVELPAARPAQIFLANAGADRASAPATRERESEGVMPSSRWGTAAQLDAIRCRSGRHLRGAEASPAAPCPGYRHRPWPSPPGTLQAAASL